MPLAHDIALRQALEEWICLWRAYCVDNPEFDLSAREQLYQELMAMLDSRKDLQ
jgi:hypothetical protein